MTVEEKKVRKELELVYPQLIINTKKVCGFNYDRWGDDLLALSILFFLEKPLDTQIKIINDGKLENYITFIMGLQVKSGSSKFYKDYRRFMYNQREIYDNNTYKDRMVTFPEPFEDEESECLACIKHQIDKLDPYLKMLVNEHLIQGENFSTISQKYNITYTHLKRDTLRVSKEIKELCKHLR